LLICVHLRPLFLICTWPILCKSNDYTRENVYMYVCGNVKNVHDWG